MQKNIFTILFLPLLFLLQGCSMLENPEPRERAVTYPTYAYVAHTKKEVLMREDFMNNTRNWRVLQSFQFSIVMENGFLVMRSDYAGAERSAIAVNTFDGKIDFEIEAYIKEDFRNSMKIRNRLLWGLNTATNQYRFFEMDDANKRFYVGTASSGYDKINFYSDASWQGAYNRSGYNKYTIRKIGNTYFYFVNEAFLYQEPFTGFSGLGIGFQVGNYNAMSIDYLMISKINR